MIREALDLVMDNIQIYQLLDAGPIRDRMVGELGRLLLEFGGLVLVLALIMGFFMYLMRQTIIVMSRLIEYDLRKVIYEKFQLLSVEFYKRNNTGDLMARISEDVSKVRMYLGPAILYGINLTALFILAISSMVNVSLELTLYSLAPLPILSISIYYISSLINKKSTKIQEQLGYLNTVVQEVFSGIRVVKSYAQENSVGDNFAKQSQDYKSKSMELARVNAFFYPLMLLLVGASTIVTVFIGGKMVLAGKISPGNIAEFVIYVNMLTWPVTAIGWVASIVQQASVSQKRINTVLNEELQVQNSSKPIKGQLKGHIQFDNVSFTYPDSGIEALKEINFDLKAGQKMAIIGRTGGGKTTIAELLLRNYDVSEGSIKVDGKDLKEHELQNLRSRLGYVPQDSFLFSDTISKNVSFGNPSVGQKDVEKYCAYASIDKDIKELPEGYDTVVGERGVTLSGGQKQRISIARALIKQPDLVILDDCLSAVDTKTEQTILSFFETEFADKTTIIITHRIYSLLEFDQIVVLDEGRIIEMGKHDELLAKKGYYADLFYKQSLEKESI
jgi:ATP-binding cassette subfamily B multidrug efflux pump